ncbi:hypothetical protein [Nonomuraea sp. NPDC002799]
MIGPGEGYVAAPSEIRRRGGQAADEAAFVEEVRDDVREAFAAAGRPMGHDQYGAELEKHYPQLKSQIFDAFEDYIEELDGLHTGLRTSAARYEDVDDPHYQKPGQD